MKARDVMTRSVCAVEPQIPYKDVVGHLHGRDPNPRVLAKSDTNAS